MVTISLPPPPPTTSGQVTKLKNISLALPGK